jgi:hypothetical protein
MYSDYVDRTRELLSTTELTPADIRLLSGLDPRWVDEVRRLESKARSTDPAWMTQLHDLLILDELTRSVPRYGPREGLAKFGQLALWLYNGRQPEAGTGLIVQSQRDHFLCKAETGLRDIMRAIYEPAL